MRVTVLAKPEKELQTITPEEKRYKEQCPEANEEIANDGQDNAYTKHFLLLLTVYVFVVVCHYVVMACCTIAHKDEWPQTHCSKSLKRDHVVKYYFRFHILQINPIVKVHNKEVKRSVVSGCVVCRPDRNRCSCLLGHISEYGCVVKL